MVVGRKDSSIQDHTIIGPVDKLYSKWNTGEVPLSQFFSIFFNQIHPLPTDHDKSCFNPIY